MQDHDYDPTGMTDREWKELTGKLPPVEAAQAAVDRIAAGYSTLDEEIERIGQNPEKVRAQVEAERIEAERLGLNATAFHIELDPQPAPAPGRPNEYWWVEWCEGMPLEPARIEFKGDTPAKIQQLGDDSWGTPLEEVSHIKLVARIPAYAADQVVITREEFVTMWQALSIMGAEAPSFGWLDSLKARVDAQAAEEA